MKSYLSIRDQDLSKLILNGGHIFSCFHGYFEYFRIPYLIPELGIWMPLSKSISNSDMFYCGIQRNGEINSPDGMCGI